MSYPSFPTLHSPMKEGYSHNISLDKFPEKDQSHFYQDDTQQSLSQFQEERTRWKPQVPSPFQSPMVECFDATPPPLPQEDAQELSKELPSLSRLHPYCEIRPAENAKSFQRKPIRLGVVLSGGPAPGGHSVIAGLFDYIRSVHPESKLFGFIGGLEGLFQSNYKIITSDLMNRYRHLGGFQMLLSGRGRVSSARDMAAVKEIGRQLDLHGLVIVGGDGSNSNAALLADYMIKNDGLTVIGVPKTIDGDLRGPLIETTFGFDTCSKTYSELIGNLCVDVNTTNYCYHFVRVMGRSASHLVLECATQCRPNLCLVGEEVEREGWTLRRVVEEIVGMIGERERRDKRGGVVLIPEGLIEFIPEIRVLLEELQGGGELSVESKETWEYLPPNIREQLMGEREATGYVQVAKIATERLLIQLVKRELEERKRKAAEDRRGEERGGEERGGEERRGEEGRGEEGRGEKGGDGEKGEEGRGDGEKGGEERWDFLDEITFLPHYFGYEGRCATPTNFDVNYCYALGLTAACLAQHKKSGYMALVRNLSLSPNDWLPSGVAFVKLMKMFSSPAPAASLATPPPSPSLLRYPGVKKSLVDLQGALFKSFQAARPHWRLQDMYRVIGPIQFQGPNSHHSPHMVSFPTPEELISPLLPSPLLSSLPPKYPKTLSLLSPLQLELLHHHPICPELLQDLKTRCKKSSSTYIPSDPFTLRQIISSYPLLSAQHQFEIHDVVHEKYSPPTPPNLNIGIVFMSRQVPGVENVLLGLSERLDRIQGNCFGFFNGVHGLLSGHYTLLKPQDLLLYKNQGGMEYLGRSIGHSLLEKDNIDKVRLICESLNLDGIVFVGSATTLTEAAVLAEYFHEKQCKTNVIGIPATGSNNVEHPLLETCIGFDTTTKIYSSLIGNVLTDAASMPKYYHFIRLMGRDPSNEVLECSLQTHPNCVIIGEEYGSAGKSLIHVVNDICDAICLRAREGKNFGTILIPEGLLSHLPNMKTLVQELHGILDEAGEKGCLKQVEELLIGLGEEMNTSSLTGNVILSQSPLTSPTPVSPSPLSPLSREENEYWLRKFSPWSLATFRFFPRFIRREFLSVDDQELKFAHVETEELIFQMVKKELDIRKKNGRYCGKFQGVTHYFGYQGRSSIPSKFDSQLSYAHGYLSSIIIESGLSGYCTSIRGLCDEDVNEWKMNAIPLTCMMRMVLQDSSMMQIHAMNDPWNTSSVLKKPIIPSSQVNLESKSYKRYKNAASSWMEKDLFCNPGPLQLIGESSLIGKRTKSLLIEQSQYLHMIKQVELYANLLKNHCSFGVNEQFLKTVHHVLEALLKKDD